VDEVRIHTGSRVRLSKLDEGTLPGEFLTQIREYAHKDEAVQAIFMFSLETEGQSAQPSMAIALKSTLFGKKDESFLGVVDEIQLLLPEDLSLNLYRFGASDFLARYCASELEPIYLRSVAWLDKQKKKYS